MLDTGADGSILKCTKIKGTLEFEPANSVNIKGVNGGIMQTHGTIDVQITEEGIDIPFTFQLVTRYTLCVTGFWVATSCKERKSNCATEQGTWCFGKEVEEQNRNC